MSANADTSWITKGAEVVTYRHSRTDDYSYEGVRVAPIERVSAKSFTVNGDRYDLDRQSYTPPGRWPHVTYCVPVGSDKGREIVAEARHRKGVHLAEAAVEKWRRERTRENRLAAIAALQAIDEPS